MAFRYREDLVGKRFLSVSGVSKINVNKVSEWGWKAGVIRAASHKDNKNKELQVLVEYDGVDWQRREWVPVYSRRTFRVFLVERTLVWAPRKLEKEEVKWPALTFTPLSADVTLQADAQPVEFLHDRLLHFLDYANLQPYQEWDSCLAGSEAGVDPATLSALTAEAAEWRTIQDGQRILTTTPSVLGGCRAQVYRVAGATQWYTAVIVGVNEHTGELTVTDDTVLEEHSEDPSLVQMRLLGDGVIESIMRGEVVGVMPRRSRSNLQRVEREATKSPATTSTRKKTGVRSNGQITTVEPPPQPAGSSPERETVEINKKGAAESVSASGDVVAVSEENKCVKEETKAEVCSKSVGEVKSGVSAGADGVGSAVASEEDDCVIVCARDADDRSDSGVSGVRSGGSASSVEEWRGMAHGYGGGPPPPLLHLPPPPPPTLYPSELLWKQRYQPPIHPQLHHAIGDEYIAAATFDRERHERLLRERREQEQREMLEKQQKEKERERIEREREREREKQEREEKERREQENAASKLVSRHFEESFRLANQKRERSISWSLLNSLAPNRGAAVSEHDRLRTPERAYYSTPPHPSDRLPQPDYAAHVALAPHAQHAPRHALAKSDKAPQLPVLPKGEPNFAPYNYPPYRYDKLKEQHLPAPPPLVTEKSVIVKHDAKQIHLEQKHQYPSKPRSEPSQHYLPSRPYRTGLSPHAPPHPHPALQTPTHAALPAQDKSRRVYQTPPQRSPAAYYQTPPVKPKVSSPAPPHIYGKPSSNSPGPTLHYTMAVEPPPATLQLTKADRPPVPYPPPSAYSPATRTRPPPVAHSRTPEPRPPPRAHGDLANAASPCQTQPLDLGVARDDPERLSPRRRCPYDLDSTDAKRRRLDSPAPEPLIAAAASVGRTPLGSEPAPQAPGPPCDVRVPSADGSVETPEKAAGASPAPHITPAASPAPSTTPVPPVASTPPMTSTPPITAPPTTSSPPAPPVTPPVTTVADAETPAKISSPSPRDGSAPTVRHLGKKAWLQRHETAPIGEGDCSGGGGTCITLPMTITRVSEPDDSSSNIVVPVAAKSIQRGARKTSKPRKPKEVNGRVDDAEEDSSSSEREATSPPKRKPPKAKRKKGTVKKAGDEPKKKKASESGSESDKESDDKDSDSGGSGSGSGSTSSKRGGGRARGRRARGGGRGGGGRRREDPPRRAPSTASAKATTAESFLQNGPCFEVAPRLAKCRECRWSPAQRDKDMPNIFCRFYAFRRLKYAKNRQLAIAGFSDPYKDAEEDDKKLWLSSSAGAAELDIEMSCFLLREIGDQFCELLQQEKEAESHHLNEDKTIAWKRVVQGVREMCDVCETTLFNFHWTCGKCGFVVCLDCYKSRTSGESGSSPSETSNSTSATSNAERDSFGWLLCTSGGAHPARRLLLTQIAAGGALAAAAARAHRVRAAFALPPCACGLAPDTPAALRTAARLLLQRALQKNVKKEEVKEENAPVNGSSPVKSENGKTGSSIVSWLSDLPIKTETKEEKSDTSSSDSEEGGNFSTLRELLIRPAPEGGDTQPKKKQKKSKSDILDDVISSVIEEKKDSDGEVKPFALSNVVKRYERSARGREQLPVRIMTLTESKLLYDVPHAWLCDGKLLHLTDPSNPGNYKPFQDQWKRGQPVLVSDVSSLLDKELWSPESFSRDFGDTRVDIVNCASGLVVPNQPARKFWDGFELAAKRLRDERGAPMVLKLKDWPPGEDFAELLPARFDDLMRALPLAEYTSRHGKLNLAARLPECFVRPDLGPKMYTAYGGAGGTTNLHLDVSDAVNVMVHASAPHDAPERAREAARAAEEAGVDVLSRRRARVRPPAALWHIYAARDADKIRDFLVRAELERGARPRAQHDPVHDQTWYLDAALRERLYREYGVEGYAILQCPGDAVFVPAGAPHQVRNLLDCIKVAEDFVSPENVSRCFELAQQFRRLSRQHANKEDKLQIKNIVYHAVKDSLCCLEEALAAAQ
ncbi:probable JmjC domain-containing histone demethylation protein 2C isoform X2 [Maniola jurtina]|uniref:probable JmjC domain-containing histone demethylation protein 2C isoform X2 n=1 Tax=Maniola jurtina TaxID=191418 RepID=UPI001E688B14|nr:probable JmjC domain-containing histone demethylation protein 2C isoform X2 [Maniola jurtina]